jgi:hypothetical protein
MGILKAVPTPLKALSQLSRTTCSFIRGFFFFILSLLSLIFCRSGLLFPFFERSQPLMRPPFQERPTQSGDYKILYIFFMLSLYSITKQKKCFRPHALSRTNARARSAVEARRAIKRRHTIVISKVTHPRRFSAGIAFRFSDKQVAQGVRARSADTVQPALVSMIRKREVFRSFRAISTISGSQADG